MGHRGTPCFEPWPYWVILRVVAAVTPLQQQGDFFSLCMYMHMYLSIYICMWMYIYTATCIYQSINNMYVYIYTYIYVHILWIERERESQIETIKQKMLQWSFRTKQRLAGTYVHLGNQIGVLIYLKAVPSLYPRQKYWYDTWHGTWGPRCLVITPRGPSDWWLMLAFPPGEIGLPFSP